MSVDDRFQDRFAELYRQRRDQRDEGGLRGGGGRSTSNGVEERVTRLETHFEYVRRDLDEIKGTLRSVDSHLRDLPTKRDLDTWRWQWIATGVGIIALTVGGITGGLALIGQ